MDKKRWSPKKRSKKMVELEPNYNKGVLNDKFMTLYIIMIIIVLSTGVGWGLLTVLQIIPPAPSFHTLTVFEVMHADNERTTILLTRGSGVYHFKGNFSGVLQTNHTYELKLIVWDYPQTRKCDLLEIWDVTNPENELHWDFSEHDFGREPNPPYLEPLIG